jgi:hypothetical protein
MITETVVWYDLITKQRVQIARITSLVRRIVFNSVICYNNIYTYQYICIVLMKT